MIYRILNNYKNNFKKYFLRFIIYSLVLFALISSLLSKELGCQVKDNIINQFPLYISVYDPGILLFNGSIDKYQQLEDEYRLLLDEINRSFDFNYYDRQYSISQSLQIKTIGYRNDNLIFFDKIVDSNEYSQFDDYKNGVFPIMSYDLRSTINTKPVNFKLNHLKLEEGRYFKDEEIKNGELVCIVDRNSAFYTSKTELERVKIDDYIPISFIRKNTNGFEIYDTFHLRVIGLYEGETKVMGFEKQVIHPHPIIIPEKLSDKLYNDVDKNNPYFNTSSFKFFSPAFFEIIDLENVNKINNFIINYNKQHKTNYMLNSSIEDYTLLLANVSSFMSNLDVVMLLCVTSYFILIVVLTYTNLLHRKKELAIFQSLGYSKKYMIVWLALEEWFIVLISLIVAIIFSIINVNYFKANLLNFSSTRFDKTIDLNMFSLIYPSLNTYLMIFIWIISFLAITSIVNYLYLRNVSFEKLRED